MLLQAGLYLEILGLRGSPMVHHLFSTHEAWGQYQAIIPKENSSPSPSLGMLLGFLFSIWDFHFGCPEKRHPCSVVWTHEILQQYPPSPSEWAPLHSRGEQVPKSSPFSRLPFLPCYCVSSKYSQTLHWKRSFIGQYFCLWQVNFHWPPWDSSL